MKKIDLIVLLSVKFVVKKLTKFIPYVNIAVFQFVTTVFLIASTFYVLQLESEKVDKDMLIMVMFSIIAAYSIMELVVFRLVVLLVSWNKLKISEGSYVNSYDRRIKIFLEDNRSRMGPLNIYIILVLILIDNMPLVFFACSYVLMFYLDSIVAE